jgi:hypothetical protein
MVSNIDHIPPFTLCELWSRSYTMHLQISIFRLQYSAVGICAAIADISTMLRALNCKPGGKCSAHPPVYAVWTVFPVIYNAFTAPYIQRSIFIWTYLRCNCRYHDNSMLVVPQMLRQILRTSTSLRCVNCGLGYLQSIYSSEYLGFNIRRNVSALLLEIIGHFEARYTANWEPNITHIIRLPYVDCDPVRIQRIYSSS